MILIFTTILPQATDTESLSLSQIPSHILSFPRISKLDDDSQFPQFLLVLLNVKNYKTKNRTK